MTGTVRSRRRWWLIIALLIAAAVAAYPIALVVKHMIGSAVGPTTVAHNADGTERTIFWRDYPGVAGIDPQETLDGPSPEQALETGRKMIAEIRSALSAELQLEWATDYDPSGTGGPLVRHVSNGFGGTSLLSVVNGTESQSTSVPETWAGKQRAVDIIGDVADKYGFGEPAFDDLAAWSDEDRVRDLGGRTPDQQVIVSGMVPGPAGQWLSFRFQDLSKDTDGRLEERLRPPAGSGWQLNTVALSYGANGLLAEEDRAAFESRLRPFLGLTPPAPLES
ncbi:hypothetical protein ACIQC5_19180 [Paenarthrobacter sp. NPDC092416]|uniref:hypothetical protein n=1 Tax=Paenarthrobacter sp. NPDC092416 TaxID=3364386 RepID=UPI0038305913